ncbi:MAG: hypothetical protein NTZ37_00040 [Methanoregula sp.]|nr:hypothetical protein [Methanoregula sp.]
MVLTERESNNRILWLGILFIISPLIILFIIYFDQYHTLSGIQDWLIPVTSIELIITVAIGSWITVNNYTLKIQKEQRLCDSSTVESNVRLIKLFSEIMQIANCRYEPILSEKAIGGLFDKGIITEKDYENIQDTKNRENIKLKLETAIVTRSYGLAAQESAIAAIYSLGEKHSILLDAAVDGLSIIKLSFADSPSIPPQLKKVYADEFTKIEGYLRELIRVKEVRESNT